MGLTVGISSPEVMLIGSVRPQREDRYVSSAIIDVIFLFRPETV